MRRPTRPSGPSPRSWRSWRSRLPPATPRRRPTQVRLAVRCGKARRLRLGRPHTPLFHSGHPSIPFHSCAGSPALSYSLCLARHRRHPRGCSRGRAAGQRRSVHCRGRAVGRARRGRRRGCRGEKGLAAQLLVCPRTASEPSRTAAALRRPPLAAAQLAGFSHSIPRSKTEPKKQGLMYATKEEARAAFTQLLYDKGVVSSWPWDKVRHGADREPRVFSSSFFFPNGLALPLAPLMPSAAHLAPFQPCALVHSLLGDAGHLHRSPVECAEA